MSAPDINQFLGSWGVEREDTGCDLCAGQPTAPPQQSCEHRCVCGRFLACEAVGKMTPERWRGLAVAAANATLWAIERGSEEEAADYAEQTVTACRGYWEASDAA